MGMQDFNINIIEKRMKIMNQHLLHDDTHQKERKGGKLL